MTDLDPSTPTGMAVADLRAKKRDAALAVLTDDERAAVDRAADEARDTALRAALAGRQVAAVEPMTVATPGAQTSEGRRLLVQQWVGGFLTIAGTIIAPIAAMRPENQMVSIIATALAALGYLGGNQAAGAHARSRAQIKTGVSP